MFLPSKTLLLPSLIFGLLTLTACGGKGGGKPKESGPNANAKFTLELSDLEFVYGLDSFPEARSIRGEVKGADAEVFVLVDTLGSKLVKDATISINDNIGTLHVTPQSPFELDTGTYTDTIFIHVCKDSSCLNHINGSPTEVKIVYDNNGNKQSLDSDGDGVVDAQDVFPTDALESHDFDEDGIGDNADTDDDNDLFPDDIDDLPKDPTEQVDLDGDGIGDNADIDDDGDGVSDSDDLFPRDKNEQTDFDTDGIGDNSDPDDDNDGTNDVADDLPFNPQEQHDTDGDGIGNNADTDDDGDGFEDTIDAFPLDKTEHLDFDNDGLGDNADPNDDNDPFNDIDDEFPFDATRPGKLFSLSPGTIIAHRASRITLAGALLTGTTLYVNGEIVTPNQVGNNFIEVSLTPESTGELEIAIGYEGSDFRSALTLDVIPARYYPYSSLTRDNLVEKSVFDPRSQSVWVLESNAVLGKYQYLNGGSWEFVSETIDEIRSFALSRDYKTLSVLKSDGLYDINKQDFSVEKKHVFPPRNGNKVYDFEFDYRGAAWVVQEWVDDAFLFDVNALSPDYGTLSPFEPLHDLIFSGSGDGSLIYMHDKLYSPGISNPRPVPSGAGLSRNTKINMYGDVILSTGEVGLESFKVYDRALTEISDIVFDGRLAAQAVSPEGDFILMADEHAWLSYYETHSESSEALHKVKIVSDLGDIQEIIISQDGLTAFVIGKKQMLTIPIWQILENKIGHRQVCPTQGCGAISLAAGVRGPDDPIEPVPLDDLESPAKVISPVYADKSEKFEIVLTGENFNRSSVVQFNNQVAESISYVSDKELRAIFPSLEVGSYTVTVDGHQTNAPTFRVLEQASIADRFWALAGRYRELVYNPFKNEIYALESENQRLVKINLNDESIDTFDLPEPFVDDMAWCADDGFLYLATNTSVIRYDAETLQENGSVDVTIQAGIASIECAIDNQLILGGSWEPEFKMLNFDTEALFKSRSFYGSSDLSHSPKIDGISRRGDKVFFGSFQLSGTVFFDPIQLTLPKYENDSPFSYVISSWSADGMVGIVDNQRIYDYSGSLVGFLNTTETLKKTLVSHDGKTVFAISQSEQDGTELHTFIIDPKNLGDAEVDNSISLNNDVGSIERIFGNMDNSVLFLAGENGIQAINLP